MLNCGVYQIKNIKTNDTYIGQSIDLSHRKSKHFSHFRLGKHANVYFQRAYNKYGTENFEFSILIYCEPFELTRYEQKLVDIINPKYNILKQCVDSPKGIKLSEETKQKISRSLKGKPCSEKVRELLKKYCGIPWTRERKKKLSEFRKGKSFYIATDESKKKMSSSHRATNSEETRKRISASLMGHKPHVFTDEQKQKISDAGKGKKRSESTKRNISESLMGRVRPPFSIEWKTKMSIARKKYYENLRIFKEEQ